MNVLNNNDKLLEHPNEDGFPILEVRSNVNSEEKCGEKITFVIQSIKILDTRRLEFKELSQPTLWALLFSALLPNCMICCTSFNEVLL